MPVSPGISFSLKNNQVENAPNGGVLSFSSSPGSGTRTSLTPPWKNLICCSPRASAATSAVMRFLQKHPSLCSLSTSLFLMASGWERDAHFHLDRADPLRGSLEQQGVTVKLLRGSSLTQGGQVGGFCGSKTGRLEVTVNTSSCEFPRGSSPETLHRQNMPQTEQSGGTHSACPPVQLCGC